MHTFPWALTVGGRWVSREHPDVESWIREYVKLQVDFLMSVHPSVFTKNETRAEVPEKDGNQSTIR